MVASLLWVRNQHAANLKELMIAKKTGWAVLRNFKSQVGLLLSLIFLSYKLYFKPLEGFELFDVLLDKNESDNVSGFFILDFSTFLSVFTLLDSFVCVQDRLVIMSIRPSCLVLSSHHDSAFPFFRPLTNLSRETTLSKFF